jgi:hypothetical protein
MPGTALAGQRVTAALAGIPPWTAMTLINSWSNQGGGSVNAQYRFWPLLNELEVIGCVKHASITGTSQFCATFATFLPASSQRGIAREIALNPMVPVQLYYTTAGVLQFNDLPAGSTIVEFHHWFSLDA